MEELVEKGILVERGIFNKKVIFADYPEFKITEETRGKVIENPLRHLNCPPRIRMGKFYTDEEYQKYIEESLKRPLPGDNQSSRKRKKA